MHTSIQFLLKKHEFWKGPVEEKYISLKLEAWYQIVCDCIDIILERESLFVNRTQFVSEKLPQFLGLFKRITEDYTHVGTTSHNLTNFFFKECEWEFDLFVAKLMLIGSTKG